MCRPPECRPREAVCDRPLRGGAQIEIEIKLMLTVPVARGPPPEN